MAIPVTCQCGQQFSANDNLAGKRIKCPTCSNPLQIPQALSSGLDDLGLLEASATQPADPLSDPLGGPMGRSDALGGSMGALGADPLANPQQGFAAGGAQPAWQGQAFGQQPAKPKAGMSLGLVLGIVGGVVVLLLVVVGGGLAWFLSAGGDDPIATSTPAPIVNNTDTPTPTDTDQSPTEPTDSNTSPTDSDSSSTPSNTDETNNEVETNTAEESVKEPTPSSKATLSLGMAEWHQKPNVLRRGAFPATSDDDDKLVLLQYSWMTQLLPHLGHQEIYDKFNFEQPWTRDPNLKYTRTVIPEFLNPADERKTATSLRSYGMGLTHFAGMSGIEEKRQDVAANYARSDPRAGVFGYKEVARPEDIKDGTSQTIMIVGTGATPQAWVKGGGATVRGARDPFFDKFRGLGSKGTPKPGTLTVMADGSVRFISADIDSALFRAMCTINGKDTVDQKALGSPLDGFSFK